MALVYGLCGMRDDDGILTFRPRRIPNQPARLRFPLTFRGQRVDVEMSPDGARYSLRKRGGLSIRYEDEEIHLSPEAPQVTRPIVTPLLS